MKSKKGFVIFEALLVIIILFMLFIGVYAAYQKKTHELAVSKAQLEERSDCMRMTNAIAGLTIIGGGASINITIYNEMNIEPNEQRIESASSYCTFVTRNVRNSTSESPAQFTLNAGRINLRTENNYIIITHENE